MLDKSTGWLGQRLVTTLLLPVLAFWAGIGALVATHFGWDRVAEWWQALGGTGQALVGGGALSGLLVLVLPAKVALPALVRGYEGLWLLRGRAARLGELGRSRQLARWEGLRLTDRRDFSRRYRCFPPEPEDLLPTRLGNALRAAEFYASDTGRYGIDAVFFWPRLYPLLPDSLRAALDAARASLEQFLVVASLSAGFVPVTATLAAFLDIPPALWLPVLVGAALLSRLAYRAAVAAALSYGELIRAAFDTHRRALMTSMGIAQPETLEKERELWRALGQQLYRRDCDHPELIRFTVGQADQ